jgi:hypothetical protein
MKKLALICWVGLSVLIGAAGGTAPAAAAEPAGALMQTQTRSVGEFQAVSLRGSFDVQVSQGAVTSVEVQAAAPLQALLETVVQGSGADARLVVRWKPGAQLPRQAKALVRVTTPRLVAVSLQGSGDLRVEGFTTPGLQVDLEGNGDVRLLRLATESLAISLLGNGDVFADGRAQNVNLSLSGNGDIHLMPLQARAVAVSLSGNGTVRVHAEHALSVSIAGHGDVVYSGNAQLASSITGRGRVRKQ